MIAGPRLTVELGNWLVNVVQITECPICMDPVVGVLTESQESQRRDCTALIVGLPFTDRARTDPSYPWSRRVMTWRRDSVRPAMSAGSPISTTSRTTDSCIARSQPKSIGLFGTRKYIVF